MRPCREPKGSGVVNTITIISDMAFSLKRIMPMQMDAAGNQWFSGTQMRLGQKAFLFEKLPSMSRSKWVTGAGLKYPAETTKTMARNDKQRPKAVKCNNRQKQKGCEKNAMDTFYLLTVPSNG